jgi:hypothetical protein
VEFFTITNSKNKTNSSSNLTIEEYANRLTSREVYTKFYLGDKWTDERWGTKSSCAGHVSENGYTTLTGDDAKVSYPPFTTI